MLNYEILSKISESCKFFRKLVFQALKFIQFLSSFTFFWAFKREVVVDVVDGFIDLFCESLDFRGEAGFGGCWVF